MADVCPHNDKIECNSIYRLDEFYRQTKIAFQNGAKSFKYVCAPGVCPVNHDNCLRLLNSTQQKQR